MKFKVVASRELAVEIDRRGDYATEFPVTVNGKSHLVRIRRTHGDGRLMTVMVNHRVYPVEIERRGDGLPCRVLLRGISYPLEIYRTESGRTRPPMPTSTRRDLGRVQASLPGTLVQILVEPGQTVTKGQRVAILEAMKMENDLVAPLDGEVVRLAAHPGQVVAKGDLLLEIRPAVPESPA